MRSESEVSQSSEVSQTDQDEISSSDAVHNNGIELVRADEEQPVTSAEDAVAHEVVTTSEDAENPPTLYVAIQPQNGNHGGMSQHQPAMFLEVVESGNLSEQITSAGHVLEGQMVIQPGNTTYPFFHFRFGTLALKWL